MFIHSFLKVPCLNETKANKEVCIRLYNSIFVSFHVSYAFTLNMFKNREKRAKDEEVLPFKYSVFITGGLYNVVPRTIILPMRTSLLMQ